MEHKQESLTYLSQVFNLIQNFEPDNELAKIGLKTNIAMLVKNLKRFEKENLKRLT